MSYSIPKKTDSLNEYFTRLADFTLLLPNLEKAEDKETFDIWFDKLRQIDPRALLIWIREHKDSLPEGCLDTARLFYRRDFS